MEKQIKRNANLDEINKMTEEVLETEQHRYLFTVRQRFGESPIVDTFYELAVPAGLTGDQAAIMKKLDARFCKEQISADTQALSGMQLRLRFNSDMYAHVCLVRTECEIDAKALEAIVKMKHDEDTLMAFLDESAIKV